MRNNFIIVLLLFIGVFTVSAQIDTPLTERLLAPPSDTLFLNNVQQTQKTKFKTIYTWGLKAEANVSNYQLAGVGPAKSTMGLGSSVGGFAMFELGHYFAMQLEALLNFQNSNFERISVTNKVQTLSVEVPLYAVAQRRLTNLDRIYVGMGPYYSMGIFGRYNGVDNYYEKNWNNEQEIHLQRFDIGVGVMIGYECWFGLQFNASYRTGLMNALAQQGVSQLETPSMQRHAINIGVGYRFK